MQLISQFFFSYLGSTQSQHARGSDHLQESSAERRLQTIHYLHYKKRIEDRLNEIVLA